MISFARLAAADSPSPGDLALALAAELHGGDTGGAEERLAELAAAMHAAHERDPLAQLSGCGRETAERLVATVRPAAVDDLLLDRVLDRGEGDPVCWAIACVHAANAAGIPLGIVADDDDHVLVAHRRLSTGMVVEPLAPAAPLDVDRLPAGDLTWRCGHETALIVLDRIVARALRAGRLRDAARAAELRLELPLDEATRARLAAERAALAARLN